MATGKRQKNKSNKIRKYKEKQLEKLNRKVQETFIQEQVTPPIRFKEGTFSLTKTAKRFLSYSLAYYLKTGIPASMSELALMMKAVDNIDISDKTLSQQRNSYASKGYIASQYFSNRGYVPIFINAEIVVEAERIAKTFWNTPDMYLDTFIKGYETATKNMNTVVVATKQLSKKDKDTLRKYIAFIYGEIRDPEIFKETDYRRQTNDPTELLDAYKAFMYLYLSTGIPPTAERVADIMGGWRSARGLHAPTRGTVEIIHMHVLEKMGILSQQMPIDREGIWGHRNKRPMVILPYVAKEILSYLNTENKISYPHTLYTVIQTIKQSKTSTGFIIEYYQPVSLTSMMLGVQIDTTADIVVL